MSFYFFKSRCTVIALSLALVACSEGFDINLLGGSQANKLCKAQPSLCEDLNKDGWCSNERSQVIVGRAQLRQSSNDANRYAMLLAYREYNSCIELAALIEPKFDKSRKAQRVIGLLTSIEELERLEAQTRQSNDPFLLLYHWSILRDKRAKQRFFALENTSKLNHPELQWALATYYTKRRPKRSIEITKGIFAYFERDDMHKTPAKFAEMIVNNYMQLREYQQAYLWALIATKFDDHNSQNLSQLEFMLNKNEEELEQISEQAEEIFERLGYDKKN